MKYPALKIEVKTGSEPFTENNKDLPIQLNHFWQWNQSNLVENRTRGILAEFIVMKALGVKSITREEWDDFDIETSEGIKIEVKSAAYIQSWKQEELSKISFDIKPSYSVFDENKGVKQRWSDVYVFCLLAHTDKTTIDPLNLNQWTFYILPTKILNTKKPYQKTITLNSLLNLKPVISPFGQLYKKIQETIL